MSVIAKQRVGRINYLKSMCTGGERHETDFLGAVQSMLGGAQSVPVGRARTGIYLLVKHAVRPGRNTVLLSPYTIPDVVNMVRLAGGVPVFLDCLPASTHIDIEQLQDMLKGDVACVLITHYHVNQDSLDELRSLCAQRDVPLYDDCAIAFGGSVNGVPLGTATDGSIFSFSIYKFLNFFWGGLVTTKDPSLAKAIADEVSVWPRLGSATYLRHARTSVLYDLATRSMAFDLVTFRLLQRRAAACNQSVELTYPRIEHRELDATLTSRPSLAAFAEWLRKLGDVQKMAEHRREIARIYRERLGPIMVSADSSQSCIAGSCFVNFPILVSPQHRDQIHREAMLAGFDLGKALYPNVHEMDAFSDIAGASDNVGAMVRSSLYLPTHFAVTPAYAVELSERLTRLL